jgi:hypothetical protein
LLVSERALARPGRAAGGTEDGEDVTRVAARDDLTARLEKAFDLAGDAEDS